MVKIMSDTSTLYTIEEGRKLGVVISPLSVTIDGKCYRDLEELSGLQLMEIIAKGHIPTSSQPQIGEVIENYESLLGDEVINITMADGLSGTYETAVMAAAQASNSADITVVNSRTLCGPHRYMVQRAVAMAKDGASKLQVLDMLEKVAQTTKSFLIPVDFDYLRRGGRINDRAGKVMGILKVMPLLVETPDGKKLDLAGVHRSSKLLMRSLSSAFSSHGIGDGEGWRMSVSHAGNLERAQQICDHLASTFEKLEIEIFELSPVFVTQGGPRCVSVQAVCKL